jgi:hypothetical protein
VFLASLRRAFVSGLNCVVLGHVFALPCCAVKGRALPVVNACLGVNPYQARTTARRGWVDRFIGGAPCGRWLAAGRALLSAFSFLGVGFALGEAVGDSPGEGDAAFSAGEGDAVDASLGMGD